MKKILLTAAFSLILTAANVALASFEGYMCSLTICTEWCRACSDLLGSSYHHPLEIKVIPYVDGDFKTNNSYTMGELDQCVTGYPGIEQPVPDVTPTTWIWTYRTERDLKRWQPGDPVGATSINNHTNPWAVGPLVIPDIAGPRALSALYSVMYVCDVNNSSPMSYDLVMEGKQAPRRDPLSLWSEATVYNDPYVSTVDNFGPIYENVFTDGQILVDPALNYATHVLITIPATSRVSTNRNAVRFTLIDSTVAGAYAGESWSGGFTNSPATLYMPANAVACDWSCANDTWTLGSAVTNSEAVDFAARTGLNTPNWVIAIDRLVGSLKASGVWANLTAFYPMVGSTKTATAQNLVQNSYNITWYGNLSTDTHHNNGTAYVESPGSSGDYGDTGINVSSLGLNGNFMEAVWNADASRPSSFRWLTSVASSTGSNRQNYGIGYGGSTCQVQCFSPGQVNDTPVAYCNLSQYYPGSGFLFAQSGTLNAGNFRVNDNTGITWNWNGTATYGYPTSTTQKLFCRHDGNTGTKTYYPGKLQGAVFGKALTTTQRDSLYSAWQTFQTSVGR